VTISQPGSYRFSGNLTVPDANTNGIVITANHVTIDFNGFSILGPTVCNGSPTVTGCSPSGSGNGVSSPASNYITLMKGGIHGMGYEAVLLPGSGQHVERMLIDSNGSTGIDVGAGSTVINNIANFNNGIGINVVGSTFTGNSTVGNRIVGIGATCPSTIIGNTAVNNGGNIDTGLAGCVVLNNAAP